MASTIDTSMAQPWPVRSAASRALAIAIAAVSPPTVSDTGNPVRSGALVASPVTLITPA